MSTFRALAMAVLAGGSLACDDARVYSGDDPLHRVALTAETAPAFESEEGGALFIVETRVELAIARPSSAELAERTADARAYDDLPFPRLPWVMRGDVELQIDFTLSNLDVAAREVTVIVNGANEFDEYVPGVAVIDEDPVPLHSQWERQYRVAGRSRVSDTVREEDLDEAAVDLATVVNGAPNSDAVVYFENDSASDTRHAQYIPDIIPGLIAVRLGLLTTRAAPLLLEATLRARDVGDKLAEDGDPTMQVEPEPFEPIFPED